MIERSVQQKLSAQNFDAQNNEQQIQIWKNVVCTVWAEQAHNSMFARDFVKIYCDNDFTLQYLVQGLSQKNDIEGIVALCNAHEQLHQKNSIWYSNSSNILTDFSVPTYTNNRANFDPMQRLADLKNAGLSLQNIRLYSYAVVILRPEHWAECVMYSQQGEQDFLFDALKVSSKNFTYWGINLMYEQWPKLLKLSDWERRIEHLKKSNPLEKSSWMAELLFSNQAPQVFNLDMARALEHVLNLFPGPCNEEYLPQWQALRPPLALYANVLRQLDQRIEESHSHHQNSRISEAVETKHSPYVARKM